MLYSVTSPGVRFALTEGCSCHAAALSEKAGSGVRVQQVSRTLSGDPNVNKAAL